jgi:metallo-beta-lactamase family protein
LGSAIIRIKAEGKTIIFSGDLGNPPAPIIEDTEKVGQANYIIMETTYGDRLHEKSEERVEKLKQILDEVEAKKGVLLIPAFAMEKTQELLYELNNLSNEKKIGKISFFVDSPLAIKATTIYSKYENYFDKDAKEIIKTDEEIFDFPGLTLSMTPNQSRQIAGVKSPKVIMAGSGMSTGGRILSHEQIYLPDPNNTILFVGFQVKGTLGRRIKEGEKSVYIMGVPTEVNAQVKEISAYSSHADQIKLLEFIQGSFVNNQKPSKVFLIHGEPESSAAFAEKVKGELQLDAHVPVENEEVILE